MKERGGKRVGAGRKSKADEQKLVEKLSPMEGMALDKLKMAVNEGERWAIELFFKYMYGLPKQIIEADVKSSTMNWNETKTYDPDKETDGTT